MDQGLPTPNPKRDPPVRTPQATVSAFWRKFNSEHPGKVFTLLPKNPYAIQKATKTATNGTIPSHKAYRSYEQAKAECEADVDRIVKECNRAGRKYRDPHFDIEWDLKEGTRNCLDGLNKRFDDMKPKGVKRVNDIFEKPQFYINGPSAGDVRQGKDGDCYLMAALCGLGNMKGLIERVCVKHDEECLKVGVYGFVFFRDGEWHQTIIDDKLYLRAPDYEEAINERLVWDDINRVDSEEEYRKAHQTGSRALFFAQCADENETWLPLLEKAYAKAHGDFAAIHGGHTGEAIEDLTGGVTVEIFSTDILDKESFWRDQLMRVGEEFLFGCSTGYFSNWLDATGLSRTGERQGIFEQHAYSIMAAKEFVDPKDGKLHRLLKVRNPWGKVEWSGKWSDGSSEWDAERMRLLGHRFGNDGDFYISYEDMLKKYQHFDRTRIFGPEWNVTQCWTSLDVSWAAEYHSTKFQITVKEKAQVVIVLSQLDENYFQGLQGIYVFELQFRLEDSKATDSDDYIIRANEAYCMTRSVSADVELEAGTYMVLMKIKATRTGDQDVLEHALPKYAESKRDKLMQMALSYDLAHAKGVYVETREERTKRKANARAERRQEKRKVRQQLRKDAEKRWRKEKKRHDRSVLKKQRKAERNKSKVSAAPVIGGPDHTTAAADATDLVEGKPILGLVTSGPKEHQDQRNGRSPTTLPTSIESRPDEESVATADKIGEASNSASVTGNSNGEKTTDVHENGENGAHRVTQPIQSISEEADAVEDKQPPPLTLIAREPTELDSKAEARKMPVTPTVEINGNKVVTNIKPLRTQPKLSIPEHINDDLASTSKANTIDTTAAQGSLTGAGTTAASGSSAADDDGDGHESFDEFEWDSELDVPSIYASSSESQSESDVSDDDSDSEVIIYRPPLHSFLEKSASTLPAGDGDGAAATQPAEADTFEDVAGPDQPWNAVCVVGLRVYSTVEGGVDLSVVYPTRKAKKKGSKTLSTRVGMEAKLDPDDPAKGAVTAVLDGHAKDESQISAA